MNEIIEIVKLLSKIREDTIISGSVAGMLYLEKKIRKCNDIDIHIKFPFLKQELDYIDSIYEIKKYDDNNITFKNGIEVDINYDDIPYIQKENYKLLKLEKILANKINRCFENSKYKDVYDLYFLLDLKYDLKILNSYLNYYQNNDIILLDKRSKDMYYEIDIDKAKNKILSIYNNRR